MRRRRWRFLQRACVLPCGRALFFCRLHERCALPHRSVWKVLSSTPAVCGCTHTDNMLSDETLHTWSLCGSFAAEWLNGSNEILIPEPLQKKPVFFQPFISCFIFRIILSFRLGRRRSSVIPPCRISLYNYTQPWSTTYISLKCNTYLSWLIFCFLLWLFLVCIHFLHFFLLHSLHCTCCCTMQISPLWDK